MPAIFSFLVVLLVSLLVVRVAGVALTVTGMPREAARFEARSAWSGTGFTTAQSEQIVRNPIRRKIVSFLIVLRNAGLVGAASTLFLSIVNIQKEGENFLEISLLLGGLLTLWFISGSKLADRYLTNASHYLLEKLAHLDVHRGMALLTLGGDYVVQEIHVFRNSWLAGKTLEALGLSDEGILVLGVDRKGENFLGVPSSNITLEEGDNLLLYGRGESLKDIAEREDTRDGTRARKTAVRRQQERASEQEEQTKRSDARR